MKIIIKKFGYFLKPAIISNWLNNFLAPRQQEEERRRQELILNILLSFSLIGSLFINIIQLVGHTAYTKSYGTISIISLFTPLLFAFLFWFSRRGHLKITSVLIILIFSFTMFYSFFTWGADLPIALLLAVLVIILSGILLSARSVFISTFIISLVLIILSHQQVRGFIEIKNCWHEEAKQICDAITHSVLLFIIAAIAWLFCREIKRSLKRALISEKLLREERDLLEIKVAERTKELKELESEKINQLYRLAEFGRLSSGIFHDLINPLTAVSLNLAQIETETDTKISSAKSYLNQALLATQKMKLLITSIKKQLACENLITLFSLNQEIDQIIQIMAYQTRQAQINLQFCAAYEIKLRGDALKFGQIVSNLLANAIEAHEETENTKNKEVTIRLRENLAEIELIVADNGSGIPPENLTKIFTPFFSTKKINDRGIGLGLHSTKTLVEKNFLGTISVVSQLNQGTTFTVKIPKDK
jgi:signal transduction histidine kinase